MTAPTTYGKTLPQTNNKPKPVGVGKQAKAVSAQFPSHFKRALRALKWWLGLLLTATVCIPVLILPRRLALGLGASGGRLVFRLSGKLRRQTIGRIRTALPVLRTIDGWDPAAGTAEEIAGRTFANLGRTIVEVIKLYFGQGRGLAARMEIRGLEHYHRAKERGKGVIFITGHFDNWELLAHAFGIQSDGLSVVARHQKFTPLSRLLERLRNRHGNDVIYADGAARQIFFRLRKNGTIGLLMDQSVQPRDGELVEFLGRKGWTTTMAAQIAARTGAALVPGFCRREGGGHVAEVFPEINPDPSGDPIVTTRLLNQAIERYIACHPDQWLWVYDRWKRVPL
jgi:KDO2-lipid IV(A) lauroyltransferase